MKLIIFLLFLIAFSSIYSRVSYEFKTSIYQTDGLTVKLDINNKSIIYKKPEAKKYKLLTEFDNAFTSHIRTQCLAFQEEDDDIYKLDIILRDKTCSKADGYMLVNGLDYSLFGIKLEFCCYTFEYVIDNPFDEKVQPYENYLNKGDDIQFLQKSSYDEPQVHIKIVRITELCELGYMRYPSSANLLNDYKDFEACVKMNINIVANEQYSYCN
jgi:hypothetical protein